MHTYEIKIMNVSISISYIVQLSKISIISMDKLKSIIYFKKLIYIYIYL